MAKTPKPTFQQSAAALASGSEIHAAGWDTEISMLGFAELPAPPWDPHGVWRIVREGDRFVPQRLAGSGWEVASIVPPALAQRGREKHQKFGLLDAPTLLAADLAAVRTLFGVAILYIDIDHFKAINTELTEREVDKSILPEFQRLVARAAEPSGHAYAEGGDEVVILLPNTSVDGALAFAEDLRLQVEAFPFARDKRLTISIGLAHAPPGTQLDDLADRANRMKADAKEAGRNQVACAEQGRRPRAIPQSPVALQTPRDVAGLVEILWPGPGPGIWIPPGRTPSIATVGLAGFNGSSTDVKIDAVQLEFMANRSVFLTTERTIRRLLAPHRLNAIDLGSFDISDGAATEIRGIHSEWIHLNLVVRAFLSTPVGEAERTWRLTTIAPIGRT